MLNKAKVIGLYAPAKGEVDTGDVYQALRSTGSVTAYPKVEGDDLRFYEVRSPDDMEPGTWGILEPKTERTVDFERIEVLIVPGVAFDGRGYRIGFGKGYYDRLLEGFEGTAVGFAYEFQMVERIPHEPTDRPCHWVVTEKRLIEGKGG